MSKRPKKKIYEGNEGIELGCYDEGFDHGYDNRYIIEGEVIGFNQAVDDMEAWLPKEEELVKLLTDNIAIYDDLQMDDGAVKRVVSIIAKRLGVK